MWFIDLLGLLYHTKVDRKGILAGAILSAAHAQNWLLLLCAKRISLSLATENLWLGLNN